RDGRQYVLANLRRSRHGSGEREPGGGRAHPAQLVRALLASPHVSLEAGALTGVVDGVERIHAGLDVRVGPEQSDHVTPMQSRSRIRPSRILVLIVPRVIPSRAATSR